MKTQTLLALFATCLVFPTAAMAQDNGLDAAQKKFTGSYVPAQGIQKDRASIKQVVEKIVSEMTFYKRPFARSALEESTQPCGGVSVAFSGDKMAINCKGRPEATSPRDGTSIKYDKGDGDTLRLSQKLEAKRMVQVFKSEDGTRKNVYTLRDGGKTLHIAVTVTSDKLPRPLTYALDLRRK